MSEPVETFYLPETLKNWPWQRNINPHHEEVAAQSKAWFHSFKAFNERSQRAFDKCDFGRLAALAYPWSNKEHLRTGCDLMNIFFVVDEYTDVENASVVREMVDIVIDALNNPHKPRPEGEVVLGELTRQFWELAIKTATTSSQHHFLESMTAYLYSIIDQAADRESNTIRTIDSYLKIRRDNAGVQSAFFPLEVGLDLPDEVFYHPVVVELSSYIVELIVLNNDISSYNREQATGDEAHNILTVVKHELNTDLEGAMAWVAKYHSEIEAKFLDGLERIPSFGPTVDKELEQYICGIANWPRCHECWSFEGGRYYGNKAPEIQKTRCVPLLPKVKNDPTLKREQLVVVEL